MLILTKARKGRMKDPYERIVTTEYTVHYYYVDAVGAMQDAELKNVFTGTINQLNRNINSHKEHFPYPFEVTFEQRKAVMSRVESKHINLEFLNTILRSS